MTDLTTFIRQQLKEMNVSQRSFCTASGISRSTIKRVLGGKARVELCTMEMLLATLGYSLAPIKTAEPAAGLMKSVPSKPLRLTLKMPSQPSTPKKRLIKAVGTRGMR